MERGSLHALAFLRSAQQRSVQVITSAAVVGQVRRDRTRRAILARTLQGVQGEGLNRRIGELTARSGTSDVVDSHLTTLILPGDTVLTSDEADIRHLLEARRIVDVRIEVVRSGAVGQHPGVVAPSRG